jgi:hypothetical protein
MHLSIHSTRKEALPEFANRFRRFVETLPSVYVSESDNLHPSTYEQFYKFVDDINRNPHGDCRELTEASNQLAQAAVTNPVLAPVVVELFYRR